MFTITENKYNIPINRLFCLGKRDNNPKRSFLFISKLLGKHIETDPDIVKASGFLLSSLKYGFENSSFISCITDNSTPDFSKMATDSGVLVIGFCETATALGLSVAASIKGSYYQATTRESVGNIPQLLSFEESHSHASTHYMFNNDYQLSHFNKIILVDDEITTGNSLLHLMNAIASQCQVKEFSIMTILDWRNKEQKDKFDNFAEEHNLKINVYSLISGFLNDIDVKIYSNPPIPEIKENIENQIDLCSFQRRIIISKEGKEVSYLSETGRFGVTWEVIQSIEYKAQNAAEKISDYLQPSEDILVLGHGENIYIPSRIASYLKGMGHRVKFKTTSRTPIFCDKEIINDAEMFFENGTKYHFYNRKFAESKNHVIMIAETSFNYKICDNLLIFNV